MSDVLTQADEQAANPLDPEVERVETIARLASLPDVEYDQCREKEAERLGCRVGTLDKERARAMKADADDGMVFEDVDPWPEPVSGAAVLDEIEATIRRHIICDEASYPAATLWAVLTWAIDLVQVAPIAAITSPEKGCGKTQLLSVLGKLSRRPIPASNISPAALFRAVDAWQPTLLIDEADAFMRENEELRGIINAGHTRDSAFVVRVVGDDHQPAKFNVWGAKAIAGIGHLPETVEDRALPLRMRRKTPDEKVTRLRHADPDHFETVKAKIARFVTDSATAIRQARPALPEELSDRAQDNWEPLLSIADAAGGHWPDAARRAAIIMVGNAENKRSVGVELLADIREFFETRKRERVFSRDLLESLCDDDEAPWATYNRGRPLSPRQLSTRLREYGIRTQTIRIGTQTGKGLMLDQFRDAFDRYLDAAVTPAPSVTTSQPRQHAVSSVTDRKPHPEHAVTPSQTGAAGECDAVTDSDSIRNKRETPETASASHCDAVTDRTPCDGNGAHGADEVVI